MRLKIMKLKRKSKKCLNCMWNKILKRILMRRRKVRNIKR
jgi:hypothetical protein